MKKELFKISSLAFVTSLLLTGCGRDDRNADKYDKYGRLILEIRNMYFNKWDSSGDPYTDVLQEKFQVSFNHSAYSDIDWSQQVAGEVNADILPDAFHYDIESFNFGNTYKSWAEYYENLKPLPTDLTPWPNIKKIFDNATNIDALKINGKFYGIPIIYNLDDPSKDFSSFTYYYRRDWAKSLGVYKDNDVYTWEEFEAVLDAFSKKAGVDAALGDADWAFPSITNFFKSSPHCFTKDANGKAICNFTSDEYITGLQKAKEYCVVKNYYCDQPANQGKTLTFDYFKNGKIGVYYDNLSLSNYISMRTAIKNARPSITDDELDDASAIMKVKSPDGKFCLEGSENWYSMTLFNARISDNKLNKMLDVIEYVLSEEGEKLAIYGIENEDYFINDGEIELNPANWIKNQKGEYPERSNGAKSLRYMATLSNNTNSIDPYMSTASNKKALQIIDAWTAEMNAAKIAGDLRLFQESADIKWMSTESKDEFTDPLLNAANAAVLNYCYGSSGLTTLDAYKGQFNTSTWTKTLNEINAKLGK